MPYSISHPVNTKQVLKLEFPTDLGLTTDKTSIRNPAFEFDHYETYVGKSLTSTYHYRSLTDHVPPEQIKKYAADVNKAENNVGFWISIPEEYRHGDYSVFAGLGLGNRKHIVGIIAAILVGSAFGVVALIVGLIMFANRAKEPTAGHKPRATPPPLPPKD